MYLEGDIVYISLILGFAGSDAKVEYLKSVGFDAAFNYKTISSLDTTLKEGCPKGIDMFFDNVSLFFLMLHVHSDMYFCRWVVSFSAQFCPI